MSFAYMKNNRKTGSGGHLELGLEQLLLFFPVEFPDKIIEPNVPHRYRPVFLYFTFKR